MVAKCAEFGLVCGIARDRHLMQVLKEAFFSDVDSCFCYRALAARQWHGIRFSKIVRVYFLRLDGLVLAMLLDFTDRHTQAVAALRERKTPVSADAVVESLTVGITNLRNLLLTRVHDDVERQFGIDSAVAPMTASQEQRELFRAQVEIEVFSVIVAADEMVSGGFATDPQWCEDWMLRLRMGDDVPDSIRGRLASYRKRGREQRRLLFSDLLVRSLPEAGRAPLVLFRLFPRAVRLTVAMAFDDPLRAAECRNEQIAILPAINYCVQCHGRPLESGEVCRECGNPVWHLRWLSAAD